MSFYEEKLRKKTRRGTILLIGIVRPAGVEVKLAVVPVEDRSVHELAIAIRILLLSVSNHRKLRFTFAKTDYILSFLNFIREQFGT